MRHKHYRLRLTLEWPLADGSTGHHETQHGLLAPSTKSALDRGLRVIFSWPGYQDRMAAGILGQRAEAEILEVTER